MTRKKWMKRAASIGLAMALLAGSVAMPDMGNGIVWAAEETDETGTVTPAEVTLEDSDFTGDFWNDKIWTVSPSKWDNTDFTMFTYADDEYLQTNSEEGTTAFKFWMQDKGDFTLTQQIDKLPAGTYTITSYVMGENAKVTLTLGDQKSETVTLSGWNTWDKITATFVVKEDEENVTAGISADVEAGGYGYIDQISLTGAETKEQPVIDPAAVDDATKLVTNGDFEAETTDGWTITMPAKDDHAVGFKVKEDGYAENNTSHFLNIWNDSSTDAEFTMTQTISDVPAGTYKLAFKQEGEKMASGLKVTVNGTEKELAETTGWDNWSTVESDVFTMEQSGDVTIKFSGAVKAGYWGDFDDIILYRDGALEEDTTVINDDLTVKKVENLSDDFIMGMDISSVISEFESGVTFKDYNGNTINNVTDFCKLLAENGVSHIRVRVWNDPYDADGNGYGGGNNDVAKAKQITDACRAAGLKVLLDFHCSDFWADPGKQQAPKAWAGMTLEQKKTALSKFLTESLNTIDPNKDTVAMVQVGNETTGGFAGESGTENMCTLFSAGADAVHSYNAATKVVIHVTNPEKGNVTKWAKNLDTYKVDYDILATSYYPYWHGTLDNLKSEFKTVKSTYGKDVMVAETSYAYTLEDSDGHNNTVRVGNNDDAATTTEPFTVQGQATSIRNLINAVNEAGGLGVFYWEPAWITVGDTTGLTGDAYDKQVASNQEKWEKYGSGWAASYGGSYDANDAGKWYGGSAVDNEAMFYADGTPTAGLRVWKYARTGAYTDNASVEKIEGADQTLLQGEAFTLPKTVTVVYSQGNDMQEKVEDSVVWNTNNVDTAKTGVYDITGTVTFSKEVTRGAYKGAKTAEVHCTLTVKNKNLITDADDAGFEKADNFKTDNDSVVDNVSSTKDDYKSGKACAHWYNGGSDEQTAVITYTKPVTLEAGQYTFEYSAQGYGEDTVAARVLDEKGNVIKSGEEAALGGWKNWQTPSVAFTLTKQTAVTLELVIRSQAGGWGTADDLYLYRTGDCPEQPGTDPVDPSDPVNPVDPTPGQGDKDNTDKDQNNNQGNDQDNKDQNNNQDNKDQNNGNNNAGNNNASAPAGKTDGTAASADNGKLTAGTVIASGTDKTVGVKDTNGVLPKNAKLSTEKVTDKAVTERVDKLVKKAVSGAKDMVVYELNLTDGTTELHQLDGKVQVTMNVPFVLSANETVKVYRVDGDKLVECSATVENGRLTFETDHFSTYAFVKVNTASGSVNNVDTGDNMNAGVFLLLAAFGMVCLYIARKRYVK